MAEAVKRATDELLKASSLLHENGYVLPALILTYSTIDFLASLARPRDHADVTRDDFMAWVAEFLLPGSSLKCAASDLYSARCGLLHTYSPESRMSRSGSAKTLAYVAAPPGTTDSVLQPEPDEVVVFTSDLLTALVAAVRRFESVLVDDAHRLALVRERAEALFGTSAL